EHDREDEETGDSSNHEQRVDHLDGSDAVVIEAHAGDDPLDEKANDYRSNRSGEADRTDAQAVRLQLRGLYESRAKRPGSALRPRREHRRSSSGVTGAVSRSGVAVNRVLLHAARMGTRFGSGGATKHWEAGCGRSSWSCSCSRLPGQWSSRPP